MLCGSTLQIVHMEHQDARTCEFCLQYSFMFLVLLSCILMVSTVTAVLDNAATSSFLFVTSRFASSIVFLHRLFLPVKRERVCVVCSSYIQSLVKLDRLSSWDVQSAVQNVPVVIHFKFQINVWQLLWFLGFSSLSLFSSLFSVHSLEQCVPVKCGHISC